MGARERERERDEFVRAAWRPLVAREIHAERLVFADEMGANISLAPVVYAWSRRGERAFVSVHRATGGRTSHLAGEHELGGDGPFPGSVEGSTTTAVFEAYLERVVGALASRPGHR